MPANNLSVILCGASGFVGGHCLPMLLASDNFKKVIAPVRHPLSYRHAHLYCPVVDFNNLHASRAELEGDTMILTLGAFTLSDASYHEVDFRRTVELAQLGVRGGVRHCLLVSSPCAWLWMPSRYLRAKARAEQALEKMDFALLDIVRPGPLLGRQSPRWQEQLARPFLRALHLLIGEWDSPFGAIHGREVAAALVHLAEDGQRVGLHHHQGKELAAITRAGG